ncbi:MAG: helix-turn-helix transcriptional regulator [Gemmatimonadota bacterium]
MAESISKTQRWLDLIAFLIGYRFPVSVEQIMEAVPSYARDTNSGDPTRVRSARRNFERDKDELRDMGIPIETTPYHFGEESETGYRLARGDFYLPYLNLLGGETDAARQTGARTLRIEPEELGVALNALRRVSSLPAFPFVGEVRSAFRKLTGDLDVEDLESRVLYAGRPDAEAIRTRLGHLSRALHKRKRVRFTYHGMYRGRTTERDLEAYGLFFQGGSWYLTGYDRSREGNRVFRVSRMEDPRVNKTSPNTADSPSPPTIS